MKKRVSLKDIAERLLVSKTTVSWVLSGQGDKKGISEQTQKSILEYADKHDYQPNYLARSLNTGTTSTIGLIVPSVSDAFYSEISKAVILEAEKSNYSVMICSSESDIDRENKMMTMLKHKLVDGIILAPTKHSKVEIEKLIKASYPLVLFDRYFEDLNTHYVVNENKETAYELVSELIRRGARKIAIFTTTTHLHTLRQREEGYVQALTDAGLKFDKELVGEVPFMGYEKHLHVAIDRILKYAPDVDGFFFTTHILAIEAFVYFAEKEIDINKGERWATLHCTAEMMAMAPRMAVSMMPTYEIGKRSIDIVLNTISARLKGEPYPPSEHVTIKCNPVFKKSL